MNKHICKAKSVFDGKWVYGYYVAVPWEYNKGIAHLIIEPNAEYKGCGEFSHWYTHRVDPGTVCRCTGWQDLHKTAIFERDVVEFTNRNDKILIWWNNEMSMLTAVPFDGIEFNGSDYWNGKYPHFEYSTFCLMMQDPYGDFSDIKVIGNIIDNTELMEEF